MNKRHGEMKMDTITMQMLSEKLGVELKVRDNDKLIDETIDHLLPKMMKKIDAAGVCTAADEAEAMDKFYAKGNRVD